MNSEAFMDEFVSKPKIGRLPPSIVQDSASGKSAFDNALIRWLLLAFILSMVVGTIYRISTYSEDDSRLLALISSTDDVIRAKNPELYFKDEDGAIAGRMVKISPETPNPPVVSGSEPIVRDKAAEKELIGIVGKY